MGETPSYQDVNAPESPYGDVKNVDSPYADGNAATPERTGSAGSAKQVEVACVGSFANPYGNDGARKQKAIKANVWEPDTDDFRRVVNQSTVAKGGGILILNNLMALFGAIVQGHEDRSVKRIDLITHSNSRLIGLRGGFELAKGEATKPAIWLGDYYGAGPVLEAGGLSEATLTELDSTDEDAILIAPPKGAKGKGWSLNDIRRKLTPDAQLALYSCEAALSRGGGPPLLLKHIATSLGFPTVAAFAGKIRYRVDAAKIWLRVEDADGKLPPSAETLDYRALDGATAYFVRVNSK